MRDINTELSKGKGIPAVVPLGLGHSIGRGGGWNEWRGEHNMAVMDTYFKQHNRNFTLGQAQTTSIGTT